MPLLPVALRCGSPNRSIFSAHACSGSCFEIARPDVACKQRRGAVVFHYDEQRGSGGSAGFVNCSLPLTAAIVRPSLTPPDLFSICNHSPDCKSSIILQLFGSPYHVQLYIRG